MTTATALINCTENLRRMFAEIDHTLIDMTCNKYHINFGLYFDELESILNEMSNTCYYNNEYNNEVQKTIRLYQGFLKTLEKYKLEQ